MQLFLTRKVFPVLMRHNVFLEVGLFLAAHYTLVGLEGEVVLAGLALWSARGLKVQPYRQGVVLHLKINSWLIHWFDSWVARIRVLASRAKTVNHTTFESNLALTLLEN